MDNFVQPQNNFSYIKRSSSNLSVLMENHCSNDGVETVIDDAPQITEVLNIHFPITVKEEQYNEAIIQQNDSLDYEYENNDIPIEIPTITVTSPKPRRCIFGCNIAREKLLKFPQDPERYRKWLKIFNITQKQIDLLTNLYSLRICFRHFQELQMAKTRIKTTPTRLQKDAMSAAAKTAIIQSVPQPVTDDIKRRIRPIAIQNKSQSIVLAPVESPNPVNSVVVSKRTNSISSVTSSISIASDSQSDSDSQPAGIQLGKNLNEYLSNNAAQLKNRKVYMITEKCEEGGEQLVNAHSYGGQKRKMYLLLEENETTQKDNNNQAQNAINPENGYSHAPKKLTLFANKSDAELTEKFDKILPEILNCIQAKDSPSTQLVDSVITATKSVNGHSTLKPNTYMTEDTPQYIKTRPPVTLPPKKNHVKTITTNGSVTHAHNSNITNGNHQLQTKQISAATPVIVTNSNNKFNGKINAISQNTTQRNINLSPDFLFLMKMLPKLESIPEEQKNYVKNSIEKIISQHATIYD